MVETALDLVDRGGAGEFSLRLLADRLNSGTATLYRHFAGKQEILDLVADRVLAEVVPPPHDTAVPWPEQVQAHARAFYAVLERHPRVAPLFSGGGPAGPAGRAARERWLDTLLGAGLPPERAARIYTTVARFVVGFAVQLEAEAAHPENSRRPGEPSSPPAGAPSAPDEQGFPATAAVSQHLAAPLREEFEYGLALLVAGLRATHPGRAVS